MFDLHKIHGNKWSVIASELKGRTDNSTKNHFYTIVRKNLRKYNKSVPENKQLKGDIKDLLKNPDLNKILLKKPGHYYQKKGAKRSSSKTSSKRASRSSFSSIDCEVVKPTLEPIKFSEEKNAKAVIKVRRSSTHSSIPGDFTPISGANRFSLSTNDMNNENTCILPSPRFINSYQASTRSSNISFTTRNSQISNISEINRRISIDSRRYERGGSILSNEGSFSSRRGSRNNTNESLEIPIISRKQSTKALDGKTLPTLDNEKLPNLFIDSQLPAYSIETTFVYNKTPRSSRNLI